MRGSSSPSTPNTKHGETVHSTATIVRTKPGQRLKSLDGLRGVAALVVVVYHIALTSPSIAALYLHPSGTSPTTVEWLFFYTPLHLVWAGREAVVIFFVLSGFVLALPALQGRPTIWASYYPRRIARLYIPAIASLCFAFATVVLLPRVVNPVSSEWVNDHSTSPNGLMQVILGSSLMGGAGGLNTPLWSLRWEVLFSLLLPLYILVARKWGSLIWVKATILIAATVVGGQTGMLGGALTFLPVFGLGVLMASKTDRIADIGKRLGAWSWAATCALTVLLLTSQWTLGGVVDDLESFRAVSTGLISIGACLAVFTCAYFRPAVRALETPVVRRLGTISFSLYLVHEPIVIGSIIALGGNPPLWLAYAVAIPAALAVATAFYWLIEKPSHMLSQKMGRLPKAALSQGRHTSRG
ncbi:acyltransferase family protein [Arthrobacter sp. NPDC058288]|uniref:acyltransferase family protein n=1 Tax=Arthrobacter sp. NPDC058288 TaxID=3346424 RepID=UPI0036F074DF